MDKTIYSKKIAESLSSGNHPEEFATLIVTLLRQLVLGRPVSLVALDAALGWPAQRVATVLKQAPGTEYDEQGNILGLGLTLRETPHVFEVEGRRLYTWCALDTLMFPVLIGKTARVASRCAATGTPITLTVAPEAVLDVEPAETMVSLLTPGTSPDIRCSFCCHVHFFASPSAANAWALTHQGIEVVPVESAFGLGQCRTNLMPAALYGSGTFADRQVLIKEALDYVVGNIFSEQSAVMYPVRKMRYAVHIHTNSGDSISSANQALHIGWDKCC